MLLSFSCAIDWRRYPYYLIGLYDDIAIYENAEMRLMLRDAANAPIYLAISRDLTLVSASNRDHREKRGDSK